MGRGSVVPGVPAVTPEPAVLWRRLAAAVLECGGKRYPARRRFLSTTDQKRCRATLVTALQNVQETACGTLLPLKRVWVLVNEDSEA